MSYGIGERAVLIALMAINKGVTNKELKEKYGLALDGEARRRLNKDGLVASHQQKGKGNTFYHELTDKGWSWVAKELSAAAPARSGSAAGALYALLNGMGKALERHNLRLAEFFGEGGAGEPRKPEALDSEIISAYRRLAKRSRDWVSLRELRSLLNGAPKAAVDKALKEMYTVREINLTLEEDQKRLTAEDRAAAIRVGRDDLHFISME
jgi:DNA-binding PadR family transcriptional regulator